MGLWTQPFARLHTPGGERIVKPGEVASIGRNEGNTVVLSSTSVSSFHAELCWGQEEARPQLRDLGSRNGTRLNGEKIERAALPQSARLKFGTCVFLVEVYHCNDETPALLDDEEGDRFLNSPFDDREQIAGLLYNGGAGLDLLLDLERERRTGTLKIGRDSVTFCVGKVLIGGAADERALGLMAYAKSGTYYCFSPDFELKSHEATALYWPSSWFRDARRS